MLTSKQLSNYVVVNYFIHIKQTKPTNCRMRLQVKGNFFFQSQSWHQLSSVQPYDFFLTYCLIYTITYNEQLNIRDYVGYQINGCRVIFKLKKDRVWFEGLLSVCWSTSHCSL